MPIGVALGIAGAGLIGDIISSSGQQDTNQANIAQTQQTQQWETQMSDTAMQRRVDDLKAAGLNPMLAVGQGGASTPGLQPIPMQNPSQSFANMGQMAGSAVGAAQQQAVMPSQINQNVASAHQAEANANEANVRAAKEAGVDTDVQQQNIKESMTRQELMKAQSDAAGAAAMLDRAQTAVAFARIPEIQANIARMGAAQNLDELLSIKADLESELVGLNINQFKLISPNLVTTAANAAAKSSLDLIGAQKDARMQQSEFGTAKPYIDTIFNWFHLGANIRMNQ